MSNDNKPTLGYWKIRGFAAPIRLLLAYANVDYNDKLYTVGPPPEFERKEWVDEKFNLGLDFPNLPYWIDGDVKLSQSLVIMHYLARKHKLEPKGNDWIRVELLENQLRDMHIAMARCVYNPDFKVLLPPFLVELEKNLKLVSEFLGNRKFVAGDYVTYVDFILFEELELFSRFECNHVSKHSNLVEFVKMFKALPAIDKYYKSDSNPDKLSFNGAPALWGGPFSDLLNQ